MFDISRIDESLDSRAVTFENPTGARGAGGSEHKGRKGRPMRTLQAGEKVLLADLDGPGTVRHIWMTFPPAPPEVMRSLWFEVFYDGLSEPSISVPCLDFFGLPLGRPVPYHSALASAQEGRGFNAYFPMPFARGLKVELTNSSNRRMDLYYQIDFTLQPRLDEGAGYLHVAFRRQNPTTQQEDFVIAEGLEGPGRYLGCNVGVRVLDGEGWYGEGEVKVFRDGDADLPTICGTGLEDYVGSAWGMGQHHAHFAGTPLVVGPAVTNHLAPARFVGFYRWHVPDPIIFAREMRVVIQQIGMSFFTAGQEAEFAAFQEGHPPAGSGWRLYTEGPLIASGLHERSDDYCATSYVYCARPQPVPILDVASAVADIGRTDGERPSGLERILSRAADVN
ncbi:MAG: glycoside hydrolase family 172 protein [Acidimicrobiales bacterium]